MSIKFYPLVEYINHVNEEICCKLCVCNIEKIYNKNMETLSVAVTNNQYENCNLEIVKLKHENYNMCTRTRLDLFILYFIQTVNYFKKTVVKFVKLFWRKQWLFHLNNCRVLKLTIYYTSTCCEIAWEKLIKHVTF